MKTENLRVYEKCASDKQRKMEVESQSGGKSRIIASQEKAWLRKDILLTVWIFHKLYLLATWPILIHLPIEIFQVLKIGK